LYHLPHTLTSTPHLFQSPILSHSVSSLSSYFLSFPSLSSLPFFYSSPDSRLDSTTRPQHNKLTSTFILYILFALSLHLHLDFSCVPFSYKLCRFHTLQLVCIILHFVISRFLCLPRERESREAQKNFAIAISRHKWFGGARGRANKGREEKTFKGEEEGKESKKVKVDAGMNEGKRTAKRGERKNEERYEEKSFITKGRTDKEASLLFINYVQVRERESKGTAFEREGREILRS